mmetsp:Transcript_78648/g.138690  ORF Transcript_78648/g.138690 Transcript_78648/m.138690 type:complete len:126 (+) Transcript_78648:2728-3105(+)
MDAQSLVPMAWLQPAPARLLCVYHAAVKKSLHLAAPAFLCAPPMVSPKDCREDVQLVQSGLDSRIVLQHLQAQAHEEATSLGLEQEAPDCWSVRRAQAAKSSPSADDCNAMETRCHVLQKNLKLT